MKKIYEDEKMIIIDTEQEYVVSPVRIFFRTEEIPTNYLGNDIYSSFKLEDEKIKKIIKKYYISSGIINKHIAKLEYLLSEELYFRPTQLLFRAKNELDELKQLLAMKDIL